MKYAYSTAIVQQNGGNGVKSAGLNQIDIFSLNTFYNESYLKSPFCFYERSSMEVTMLINIEFYFLE